MARILITGGNGQLGSELAIVSKTYFGYDFIFTDLDTLDLTNEEQTIEFIKKTNPDWVINCAAFTQVDKAESEPAAAMLGNAKSVDNITKAIEGTVCKLIHISTDYVYEGNQNTPYSEYVAPNPLSSYGKSKLAGEKFALSHYGSIIIRTSWLYSSFGNNFLKTILKNAAVKESLNVVYDQTGTPTYAADLAGAIMQIVSGVIRNQFVLNSGIYNYSNEGVCTWYDFATEIVKETGLNCVIKPILTKDYPLPASRPVYSVLDKTKIKESYNIEIPHWRTSMKKCIQLLKQ
jgi:dTDP-4-dehydrorhamnose reductase